MGKSSKKASKQPVSGIFGKVRKHVVARTRAQRETLKEKGCSKPAWQLLQLLQRGELSLSATTCTVLLDHGAIEEEEEEVSSGLASQEDAPSHEEAGRLVASPATVLLKIHMVDRRKWLRLRLRLWLWLLLLCLQHRNLACISKQ